MQTVSIHPTPKIHARLARFHTGVEALEARIAPAAATTPAAFCFSDADGDMVKVQFTGSGHAELKTALQADVRTVNGFDIESIVITDAKPDFSIAFSDLDPGVHGDGVMLGKISGAAGARVTPIAGIYTLQSGPAVAYHLAGYYGTQFAPGGGLEILGTLNGTIGSGGVDLLALPFGTGIHLRDGVASTTPSVKIAGSVGGSFIVDGEVDGAISLLGVTATADVQLGTLTANLTVERNFAGHLTIVGGAGRVEVNGSVLAPASIVSGGALTLHVGTDLTAQITAPGDLVLDVRRDLLSSTAVSGGNLTLEIGGSISGCNLVAQEVVSSTSIGKHIGRSAITGGDGLFLDHVAGDVSSSQLSSGSKDLVLDVRGKLNVSRLSSGGDMDLTVGRNIVGGTLLADGEFKANVLGAVVSAHLGSKDSKVMLTVAGAMSGQVRAGTDAEISVGTNFLAGQITGPAAVKLKVGGNVQGLTVVSGGLLEMSAVNLDGSFLYAGDSLDLALTGTLKKTRIETEDGDATVTADGAVSALRLDSAGDLKITGASFDAAVLLQGVGDVSVEAIVAAKIPALVAARIAGANVAVKTPAAFRGAIAAAHDLTMIVGSIELLAPVSATPSSPSTTPTPTTAPVTPPGTPPAPVPLPLISSGIHIGGDLDLTTTGRVFGLRMEVGGDVHGFSVTGSFDGTVRVAGDFTVGASTDTVTKIIGGSASKTSLLAIGGDLGGSTSAQKLGFGAFAGRIQVQGKLLTDVEFSGSVYRLAFAGGIGPTPLADHIAQITVTGTLTALGVPTTFIRTPLDPKGGNFVDAANITLGSVTTTKGLIVVRPALF
jgi:hypothetical protein